MKLNEYTAILTPKILLVPYSSHHVETYHEWMQDEALQKATASEPLALEAEHSMQQSWRNDADKLTFICCVPPPAPIDKKEEEELRVIESGKHDTPDRMIGDVNLFLSPSDDDDDGEGDANEQPASATPLFKPQALVGELEIMIASPTHRSLGLGHSILQTFLWYILTSLPSITTSYHAAHSNSFPSSYLRHLRVKIDKENVRSIRLFEKVGFRKVSEEANYFGELELRRNVGDGVLREVQGRVEGGMRVVEYR